MIQTETWLTGEDFNTTSVFIKPAEVLGGMAFIKHFNTTSVFIKLWFIMDNIRIGTDFNTTSVFIKLGAAAVKAGIDLFQYNICFY